jgi:hypothetical protein
LGGQEIFAPERFGLSGAGTDAAALAFDKAEVQAQIDADIAEREKLEREKADVTGADGTAWTGTTSEDLLGYDPLRGGNQTIVGTLQGQLGAWADLEGTFRADYNWTTMGDPQTPKEAFMFLQQAQGDPVNQITFTQISVGDPMYQRARQIIAADAQGNLAAFGYDTTMLGWASDIISITTTGGGELFTRGGQVVTDQEEISKYKKLVQFKGNAQRLVEGYRVGRQNLFEGAIQQSYATALGLQEATSAKAVAKIQKESAAAVANIQKRADEAVAKTRKEISTAEVEGRKLLSAAQDVALGERSAAEVLGRTTVSTAEITGRETVSTAQIAGAMEVEKERSRGAKEVEKERGTQAVNRIREQATLDISNIEAQRDADLGLQAEEINFRRTEGSAEAGRAIRKIEVESEAQQTLVQLSADLDMELETSKQGWQTAENNKQLAIQEGNLQESIRASFMQEQIQIEQQQIERETNSLNMLMNVSQNPALLYFMKQSGMLSGVGETLLGEDTASLIDDLTASIDPGNLPNIQTYNAMSELQQQISSFRTGATTGMSPKAQQEYLMGSSPFTRGQQSTVRIGSRINPFETMNA